MTKRLWRIDEDRVMHGSQEVARISKEGKGFRWDGLGMYRTGFKDRHDILEDVKYFYRYRSPALIMRFASGKRVVIP